MKKFYPSSAAFMVGDVVMTKYDSGCLRSILVKSTGIRTGDIHPTYKRVGAAHEDTYHKELLADTANTAVMRERVVKKMIGDDVEYSGRMDFKTFREGSELAVIHETKGTVSKNTRRDFRKGDVNVSYLAQLVSYMIDERTTRGKLVHGYYEENAAGELVEQERRVFKVTISDTGRVEVDDEPTGYNAADLLAHRRAAADVIENHVVGPRPDKALQSWGGPCGRCAFKRTCDLYDQGAFESADQFLASAAQDAETARATPQPDPVVNKVKVPKEVKVSKPKRGAKKHGSQES